MSECWPLGFCELCFLLTYFFVVTEAVSCILKAIEIYTDMGRFTVAAKQHQVNLLTYF